MNVKIIIADMATYPGPDGRGLDNVHWQGRVVGYSHGGHRDRVHRIPGTHLTSPRPFPDPRALGFTRSFDEVPQHEIDREKRAFHEWVEKRPWFVKNMRVDVIDDACMRRLEYRIYW